MQVMSQKAISACVAVCAFSALVSAPAVLADTYLPVPLDVSLLGADEIDFATITNIVAAADDPEACDIELTAVTTLFSRWRDVKVRTIRVQGVPYVNDVGTLQVRVPHRSMLSVGTRYLLFLLGGSWRAAPISPLGLYAISDEGFVQCAGGEVFGIDPGGLLCSRREQQVSAPLTESELGALLSSALSNARARRPEFAAEEDRNVQPLSRTRTARGTR